jgi:hypothetical protein
VISNSAESVHEPNVEMLRGFRNEGYRNVMAGQMPTAKAGRIAPFCRSRRWTRRRQNAINPGAQFATDSER